MKPQDIQRRAREIRESWRPDPEQIALRPDISGNTVNGLGETDIRRPTPVYWQDPETIAHGAMQEWFGAREMIPLVHHYWQERQKLLEMELPPKAPQTRPEPASGWREAVERAAIEHGADMIGVAAFDPVWVYDRKTAPTLPLAIMIAVEQDYDAMSHAPDQIAGAEVLNQYRRALGAARGLAGWILEQGYAAEPHGAPTPATFTMIPAAIAAGLGELGKHGSMINRHYGSNFRLSAVLTDMPLALDGPDEFGADDFCRRCRVCEEACPPGALQPEKQTVRGVTRWYVDFDKCQPFFNEHLGCSICTTVCPWSQPGIASKLLRKTMKRAG